MTLQVYSASLLKEGLVAYLCIDEDGISWSTDLNKATAVDENSIDSLKAEAERSEKENIVVGAYAVEVTQTANGLEPVENRERIRAYGPTISLPQSGSGLSGQHAA
ncbi:DUF2849 domain-containing protein [Sneathiella glossodoripedis]|uniref:DUF2849 domain-containing protein n=1 Tax=Sneathiella glossodoripedis TaxID=418853 RepID=UPI000470DD89|nr:DUF2849 domain-containing protein [Sneathiella glossodoripedis]